MATHETFDRKVEVKRPSNRLFGWMLVAFFCAFSLLPILRGEELRWGWLVASGLLAAVTMIRPALFSLPNRLWVDAGLAIGRSVGLLAIAVIYFVIVTPLGIAMRYSGKDPLRLKRDPAAGSYWIERPRCDPTPESMKQQF